MSGKRLLRGAALGAFALFAILPAAVWGCLALWYRLPAPEWARAGAAVLFGLGALAAALALLTRGTWKPLWAMTIVFAALLVWWSTILPPASADWAPDVARQSSGEIDGQILTIRDLRNFDWRSEEDFTERWETRQYDLGKLRTLDLFLSYWAGPEMAHFILSFGFEGGEQLAWSIEVRRVKGGVYSPVADLFKQDALVVLAADERDVVRLRSNVRREDVRLYRLNTPPDQAAVLLREYVEESNALTRKPQFYNSLTTNCTTAVAKMIRAAGARLPFDWRLIVNGYLPGFLYDRKVVNTAMPLDELMKRAAIDPQARAADNSPDFARLVRVGVPTP